MIFTVVIPLYNKEKYIGRCIESVLSQEYKNFELIVVNDGSTDDSFKIASSYKDERIKIVTQANGGVSSARNRGVVESSGVWAAFLDGDDVWAAGHLEELRLLIKEFDGAGIVSTRSVEISSDRVLDAVANSQRSNKPCARSLVDYFRCATNTKGLIHSSSVAVHRNVFEKVGYFQMFEQGEDTQFWARVCIHYPCAVSDKPTSFYCRGTGGVMEQLWESKSDHSNPLSSARDLGPALAFLVGELESGRLSGSKRASVTLFINSRIITAIKVELYSGFVDSVSSIGKCFISPLSFSCWIWKALSGSPRWLLKCLYSMRKVFRIFWYKSRVLCQR